MNRKSLSLSAFLAFLTLALAGATGAQAFVGTAAQRHACHDDAMRLCGQHVPNVPAITACMERHLSRLSPPCRAQFR
jgi:hypothetical protein